jgi:hypothetical protein
LRRLTKSRKQTNMALLSPSHLRIRFNRHSASQNNYTSKLETQEGKRCFEKGVRKINRAPQTSRPRWELSSFAVLLVYAQAPTWSGDTYLIYRFNYYSSDTLGFPTRAKLTVCQRAYKGRKVRSILKPRFCSNY